MVAKNDSVRGRLTAARLLSQEGGIHEGMAWGAVARKRTPAIGPAIKTRSNPPETKCRYPKALPQTYKKNDRRQNGKRISAD
jgi:hypothetical protein